MRSHGFGECKDIPDLPVWEVASNPKFDNYQTYRLKVAGGWIYRYTDQGKGSAMVFVSDPPLQKILNDLDGYESKEEKFDRTLKAFASAIFERPNYCR